MQMTARSAFPAGSPAATPIYCHQRRNRIEIVFCHVKARRRIATLAQNRLPKFFPSAIAATQRSFVGMSDTKAGL